MSTDDKRIREFAYQIWESEGKPDGQGERHWEMARKLAEAEALAPKKSPKAAGGKTAEVKTPAAKLKTPAKAKQPSAAKVVPPGEKAAEKKPRAARKPPAN
ncbi:DUF2934 domain-containing protein [Pseudomonas sp. NPDC098747]|uniref:DUF2934 domain-containing protein n=1 Tax=Pseudomonas sp. NPDC098747 TaxID=3364487 RepID=UPI00383A2D0B